MTTPKQPVSESMLSKRTWLGAYVFLMITSTTTIAASDDRLRTQCLSAVANDAVAACRSLARRFHRDFVSLSQLGASLESIGFDDRASAVYSDGLAACRNFRYCSTTVKWELKRRLELADSNAQEARRNTAPVYRDPTVIAQLDAIKCRHLGDRRSVTACRGIDRDPAYSSSPHPNDSLPQRNASVPARYEVNTTVSRSNPSTDIVQQTANAA